MTGAAAWRGLLSRWVKFNAVGAIGIAVQLGALAVLVTGLHVNYLAATAIAVEVAVLHNFIWHERFTWKDRAVVSGRQTMLRLLRFNLSTGMISVGGNLVLMRLLTGTLGLNYLFANSAAIAALSLANFAVSHLFVFRPIR
jgi:putative flippase GtrA